MNGIMGMIGGAACPDGSPGSGGYVWKGGKGGRAAGGAGYGRMPAGGGGMDAACGNPGGSEGGCAWAVDAVGGGGALAATCVLPDGGAVALAVIHAGVLHGLRAAPASSIGRSM
eukprot:4237684-Prymnesium_polylepis.1